MRKLTRADIRGPQVHGNRYAVGDAGGNDGGNDCASPADSREVDSDC